MDVLRKHEHAWSDQLGEINVTEMRTDLLSDPKPFKYPPLGAGPKTLDLERAEIDKQLKSGIIELAMS